MVDEKAWYAADDEVTDAFTDDPEFGTIWALLWLVAKSERHAVARAIVGDKSHDEVGAESLRKWAEPQLAALRRDEGVPTIPWLRVARILRKLSCNKG
jgi:hypothetical protein